MDETLVQLKTGSPDEASAWYTALSEQCINAQCSMVEEALLEQWQGAPYFCVLLPLFAPPLPGAALLGQETMSWSAFDGWAGAPPSCLHIAS